MATTIQVGFATQATAPRLCVIDTRPSSITISDSKPQPAPRPPEMPQPATTTASSDFSLARSTAAWEARMRARYNEQTARSKISRLRRFTDWLAHEGVRLNDWRDCTPSLVDRFIQYRMVTPAANAWGRQPGDHQPGGKLVKPATIARDVEAIAAWLRHEEEAAMTGPIRSQYLRGRVPDKRDGDTYALTAEQQAELLRLSWMIVKGQSELKIYMRHRGKVKCKSATCTDWPPRSFHAFVRICLELGLRPREAFWVNWQDFTALGDGQAVLEVRDHQVEIAGRAVPVNSVKTKQSRRKLLVPADLWTELQELREVLRKAGDVRPFLFAQRDDSVRCGWRKPEISFAFKALKEAMAEPRLRCNTLRKTCLKNLRDKGLDLFQIAALAGHAPQTTMQWYVSEAREGEAFDPSTAQPVRIATLAAE